MKNRIKISLVILILPFLHACSEDFVDIIPQSIETAETFIDTEEEVELAMVGLYSALQSNDLYGQNYAYFTEHYSDNAIVRDGGRAGGRYLEFVEFEVNSGNLVLNPFWDACYKAIQRANTLLNRIQNVEMEEELKQKRIAEARFIRAMIFFDMVRIWGGVPLVIDEIESPLSQYNVGRNTEEEVYDFIINELNEANHDSLPLSDNTGRVSRGAVKALLGKVYLTRQNWSQASNILASLVADNSHQLLTDFSDVFNINNENNAETIFEIQYQNIESLGSNFHRTFGPSIGDNSASEDLVNAFGNDPRFNASYLPAGTFFFSRKYFDTAPTNQSSRNLIYLRYADVLLMLAESLNEEAYNTSEAFTYLNQIRNRAGLSSLSPSDLPNQERFREEVRKQRRLELAHENTRWFDLVRWDLAVERIQDAKAIQIEEHQLFFPLPEEAISENPALTQNPGYF